MCVPFLEVLAVCFLLFYAHHVFLDVFCMLGSLRHALLPYSSREGDLMYLILFISPLIKQGRQTALHLSSWHPLRASCDPKYNTIWDKMALVPKTVLFGFFEPVRHRNDTFQVPYWIRNRRALRGSQLYFKYGTNLKVQGECA